jgi:hypothetical protein
MKAVTMAAALAALVALGGCNRFGGSIGNNQAATNTTNAASADANGSGGKDVDGGNTADTATDGSKNPGADSSGGTPTVDRAYVVGRWTDNNDCSNAVDFRSDGRFVTSENAEGLWNLDGDRLTMTGSSTLTLRIVPIDQDTMNVVNPNGALGRSTRC